MDLFFSLLAYIFRSEHFPMLFDGHEVYFIRALAMFLNTRTRRTVLSLVDVIISNSACDIL